MPHRPAAARPGALLLGGLLQTTLLLSIALVVIAVAVAPALAAAPSPSSSSPSSSAGSSPGNPPYRVAPVTTLKKRPTWVVPVAGYRLTARFGATGLWSSAHTGLDFAAPSGTLIVAATGGQVVEAGYDGAYGYKTVVRAADGTELWYCHQSTVAVSVGQVVAAGEPIGTVGSTGNSTGSHLHLEVRDGPDNPLDPYAELVRHGATP